jgi:uncharacterized protein
VILIGQRGLTRIYPPTTLSPKTISVMAAVFLDTSFAIALASVPDRHHWRAVELADQLEANQTQIITTQAILLEIGNALSKQRHRLDAIQLLDSLQTDPRVEIIPLTDALYAAAFTLFKSRPDKEWGLVDCTSIVVMQQRELIDVLTADEHFRQAGFRPLLTD